MLCYRDLEGRYGENYEDVLKNKTWLCPVCKGTCNCSFCRRRSGKTPTGILKHEANRAGFNSVSEYLAHKGERPRETLAKEYREDKAKWIAERKARQEEWRKSQASMTGSSKRKRTASDVEEEEKKEDRQDDDNIKTTDDRDGAESAEGEDDGEIFDVGAILDKRFNKRMKRTEYRVRCEFTDDLVSREKVEACFLTSYLLASFRAWL